MIKNDNFEFLYDYSIDVYCKRTINNCSQSVTFLKSILTTSNRDELAHFFTTTVFLTISLLFFGRQITVLVKESSFDDYGINISLIFAKLI